MTVTETRRQDSGQSNVHFYSTDGDLHDIKVFVDVSPESVVLSFTEELPKGMMG